MGQDSGSAMFVLNDNGAGGQDDLTPLQRLNLSFAWSEFSL